MTQILFSLQLINEADNLNEVVGQRKKEIDQIQNIMLNINEMAKDINQEVYD
jgi:hypothetical protein